MCIRDRYYVLLEAVELRQAPWIMGWVNDLTAQDPYYILPVLNGAIMFLTQKMTPMVGMDPMQKKMMQMMPLVMAVMFAFFPAGLVPVSYTHLDVYKRQGPPWRPSAPTNPAT